MTRCRNCGLPRHFGVSCQVASVRAWQYLADALNVTSQPETLPHATHAPVTSRTAAARQQRWRKAHPAQHRQQHAEYMRAYRARQGGLK